MRSILMTVMLLLTVVLIYMATVGGEGGMKQSIRLNAERSRGSIESINP
ncbi:hypothetical protein ACFQWB_13775 [Paenibacillus thermoaerophilus]|uniref:Uncharacterized protein n=1 Tax=Paenibacillus thermoaerophilus TaxID=1215385 RepID=A0ABW2V6C9_9BACL|nr:hypothetical protein [Paenibacillus thermoaerophilus]